MQASVVVACEATPPPPPPPARQKSLENQLITGNSLYILKRLTGALVGLVCLSLSFNSKRFYSAPRGDMT